MFNLKVKALVAVLISLTAVSAVSAKAPVSIAVEALSQKLKSDLAVPTVDLKVGKVASRNITKNTVLVTGSGAANGSPIKFDVRINKNIPVDVVYVFPEAPAMTAADSEDVLTHNLLKQLNKDYKTTNLVVSIDGFDAADAQNGAKHFKGTGEVRVGFDWSRIEFDVTMDAKTNTPTAIKYQIKEKE